MFFAFLFFGIILIYLVGSLLSIILHNKDRLCTYAAFISSIIASILGIIFSFEVISGNNFSFALSSPYPVNFSFFVDKLSAFFILVISLSVLAVSIYSTGYVREYFGKKDIGYLGFLYNAFILAMILVTAANNVIVFLISWELMSVLSYFLVIHEHENPQTRKAGLIYIVMTHVGTGFIIISFLILVSASNSFDFDSFRGVGAQLPSLLKDLAFLFALIGFGTKAGIIPLHIWLPYAHPAAPSNVSALMSGVMIKTGIYMFIRMFFDFLGADVLWWGVLLLAIATISSLLGVMYALVEHDIKRLLAFHSIENIGIILIGVSISMIFMSSGQPELAAVGLIAGLYHLINHAVFKSLLFMGAGSIIYSTHIKNIEEMGGLIKKMPWTALFFLIGAVSISGLPPLNGFVSEWLTFQAQLLSINLPNNMVTLPVLFSGAGLALTSALAAACFAKAFGACFLALPRSAHCEDAKEVPFPMLAGMAVLSLACIVLGLLAFQAVRILDSISAPITGISIAGNMEFDSSIGTIPPSAGSISTVWIALLLLGFAFIAFLIIRKNVSRTYETWGCGQPFSNARNEYTATAFAKPIQMWLSSLYRRHREIQTTYSDSMFFKSSMKFESEVEQIFERYLYSPLINFIMSVSRTIKIVQIGSIHAYLAYIFVTLVLLLMFVIAGDV